MTQAVSRRRLLEAGVGAVLVLGGFVSFASRVGRYPAPGRRLSSLSPWQYAVVQHASRRIAAPDRPGDPAIPSADDVDVVGFVDAWLSRAPAQVERDLERFLVYLEHVAPVRIGFVTRFSRLAPGDQDRVLASIEASPSHLLRAGFEGLKALVFMGYYRDARTWSILGYDGPLVERPAAGWR